jgi:hypothetical protein
MAKSASKLLCCAAALAMLTVLPLTAQAERYEGSTEVTAHIIGESESSLPDSSFSDSSSQPDSSDDTSGQDSSSKSSSSESSRSDSPGNSSGKAADTAVGYIKAFGKAKTWYENFVIAAKEGADCFIDWMRCCYLWRH